MKVYGSAIGSDHPHEMREISFVASSGELRSIAEFLIKNADLLDKNAPFDHAHYSDYVGIDGVRSEIIVFNPSSG